MVYWIKGGFNFSKKQKWLISVLGLLAIGFIVFLLLLDTIVKNRIIKEVSKASDGKYTLEIKNLNAQFFSGAIRMDSVWLKPIESFTLDKNTAQKKHVPNIRFYLDSVSISSIDWFQYLVSQKKLLIGKVVLRNPDLFVKSNLNESASIKAGNRDFLDYLPGIVAAFTGSLQIESIQVIDGMVSVNLYGGGDTVYQKAEDVDMLLEEIKIDTTSLHKVLFSKEASLKINDYHLSTTDGMYKVFIKEVSGKMHDSTLSFDDINFYRNNSMNVGEREELNVNIKDLKAGGVNFNTLFRAKKIAFRNMKMNAPDVVIYNSEIPRQPGGSAQSAQSILEQIAPFIGKSFNVDTLAINNGRMFHQFSKKPKGRITQSADDICMYFTRVKVDSSIKKEQLFVEDIDLKVSNYKFNDSDSLKIAITSFHASVSDSLFHLDDIEFASVKSDQISFTATQLKGYGVNYLDILDSRETRFSYLGIEEPEIYIHSKPGNKQNDSDSKFFEKIVQPLSDFKISSKVTSIDNAKFYHSILSGRTNIAHCASNVYLKVNELGIDKSSVSKKDFFNQMTLQWRKYKIKFPRQNFLISVNSGYANYKNKKIVLDTVRVNQLHSFDLYQKKYFRNQENRVVFNGFNYDKFFKSSKVSAEELKVYDVDLFISNDEKHLDTSKANAVTPQIIIKKIPFPIAIDTVTILNSKFTYNNVEDKAKVSSLYFENVAIGIKNFTNDSCQVLESPILLQGMGYLQGETMLRMNMILPDLKNELNMKLSGSIEPVDGKVFNELLALGGLQVRRGMLEDSRFKMSIAEGEACGNLLFQYNDLKLDLIDSVSFKKRSKIINSAANFIVQDNNPPAEGEEPKIVSLNGDFKKEDNFLQFIWMVLSDGLIASVTKNRVFEKFVKR